MGDAANRRGKEPGNSNLHKESPKNNHRKKKKDRLKLPQTPPTQKNSESINPKLRTLELRGENPRPIFSHHYPEKREEAVSHTKPKNRKPALKAWVHDFETKEKARHTGKYLHSKVSAQRKRG